MFGFFLHWCVSGLALWLTSAVVPGVKLKGFSTALVAVLLIAFANYLIRPILIFLTLPLTIITFGLFIFVVDAIILRICASFMSNFEIRGWFPAIVAAIVLAIADTILHMVLI